MTVPEQGTDVEMKLALCRVCMTDTQQDMLLIWALTHHGLGGKVFQRMACGLFHYRVTVHFSTRLDDEFTIDSALKRVALEAHLWLDYFVLPFPQTVKGWQYGIACFTGCLNQEHSRAIARRLEIEAEQEKREYLAKMHHLIA